MTYAYLRQVPGCKSLLSQQRSIVSFALGQGMEIDKEVVEYSGRNRPIEERRQFEEFIHSLGEGDNLVVDEIWTLSSRVEELVKIMGCTISRKIALYIADKGVLVTKDTPMENVVPPINEVRESGQKSRGGVGRPKGSKSHSKFDAMQPDILKGLKEGRSVSSIARELGVSRSSLKDYIESRDLKSLAQNRFLQVGRPMGGESGTENGLLICPFEREEKKMDN